MTGVGHRLLHQPDQTTAARDFHVNDMDEFDVVGLNDPGQLFAIGGGIIQFGTADDGDLAFDEMAVEIGIGERGAVGGHQ